MKKTRFIIFCTSVCTSVLVGCIAHRQTSKSIQSIDLDTLEIRPKSERPIYRETPSKDFEIIDSHLDLTLDWKKETIKGKAILKLVPYFYSQAILSIDAVDFDIYDLYCTQGGNKIKIAHNYDGKKLEIEFEKAQSRKDTLLVFVQYATKEKKQEVNADNSKVETGFFFINSDTSISYKPVQFYTQSETQSASCWFPTIDAPNQRMTQEIAITIDKKFTTLSNGLLVKQTDNKDGSRTDLWKQSLPAAPYLTMLAVGDFSVTKEKWRNKEVSFYVEKKFAKESPHIFKNTTGMLDFFSQKLGVDFPWEKYAQVVVRDYPGGSMENTSATLHGEFMLTTERERLDDAKEEYISHELMHQWFGDLVTCESWSNVPLNESFATYGEYLWLEYKEGKEAADVHLQADLNTYFTEAKSKQANLIRFDYDDRDEMFDRHSYEKGCGIIHMLRNYLGDDAFFEALKTYLNEHQFSAVEVHDLRLAFEKVSGKDLNWFFNQWFLASGFPFLNISTEYQPDNKTIHIQIEQAQGGQNTPIYRLPIAIDVYSFGKKERHLVQIENKKQEFVFSASAKPNLVNVDADKVLLCKKRENKSIEEWVFQYKNAPLYLDRFEAIDAMGQFSQSKSKETIRLALQDKNWSIRKLALMKIEKWHKPDSEIKAELMALVLKDKKPEVRSKSLELLVKFYNGDEVLEILKTATEDNSYAVVSSALKLLFEKDPEAGFEESKRFEEDSSLSIGNTLLTIFATAGSDAEAPFFLRQDKFMGDYARYGYLQLFGKYLLGRSDSVINISLPVFENAATNSKVWWVRLAALQGIKDLKDMYQERENELMLKKKTGGVASKKSNYTVSNTLENAQKQKEKLDKLFNTLKEKESSADVLRYF